GGGDHAGDAAVVPGRTRISDDALLQALGLADIEHLAGRADHAVDAGRGRRELGVARDHDAAGAERAGRVRRFDEILRRLGQRLVVLLVREVDLGLDVLRVSVLWIVHDIVHGNTSRAPTAQTQASYWSMIFSEHRNPLSGIMLAIPEPRSRPSFAMQHAARRQ